MCRGLVFFVSLLFLTVSSFPQLVRADSVPPMFAHLLGKLPKSPGPNCFNSALLSIGLNRAPRFASSQEIQAVLDGPRCRLLSLNLEERGSQPSRKSAQERDIETIWHWVPTIDGTQAPDLEHAFTLLDTRLGLTKNGADETSTWAIQPIVQVEKYYGLVQSECRGLEKGLAHCKRWSQVYRCKVNVQSEQSAQSRMDKVELRIGQVVMSKKWGQAFGALEIYLPDLKVEAERQNLRAASLLYQIENLIPRPFL